MYYCMSTISMELGDGIQRWSIVTAGSPEDGGDRVMISIPNVKYYISLTELVAYEIS